MLTWPCLLWCVAVQQLRAASLVCLLGGQLQSLEQGPSTAPSADPRAHSQRGGPPEAVAWAPPAFDLGAQHQIDCGVSPTAALCLLSPVAPHPEGWPATCICFVSLLSLRGRGWEQNRTFLGNFKGTL
jgi:hypothetical protein